MIHPTPEAWLKAERKRVLVFGMSGLGKTRLSSLLRAGGGWFHYSVDYRIGTRYMDEHITDEFKRAAMRVPLLRDLLMSDSVYIASNITFDNLAPLSSYLGKPGDPERGGLPFAEYMRRQEQHRVAEISALLDVPEFIGKAREIYQYPNFICDSGGSICEVVDPHDPGDEVLTTLSAHTLMVWIEGGERHVAELARRFDRAPKPMYYEPDILRAAWAEYLGENGLAEAEVDPDAFVRWAFARALAHRLPRYRAMAENWGITITAEEVAEVTDAAGFEALIARALERRGREA